MMKEINKENDIFLSTLINPQAEVSDLLANGISSVNTGFLDKDTYKQSKFVQNAFTDDKGVFNNEAFDKAYQIAQDQYTKLSSIENYKDLSELSEYSQWDIYAPVQSDKMPKQYEIHKVRNPLHQSEGVTALFGKSESDKSQRELAQMHKVWDSENEKWLDYTAEDQGLLGVKYLFSRPSLVYATWDEDGTHFDQVLGRTIEHHKGDWKTDENGEFYTETIGNRQSYGKEFVAYSDILTKEDSWANNIDFFDSDDKNKSLGGIAAKFVAQSLPYMFPVVREIWGGVTATIGLATVLPTFGKMLEGIAHGDEETDFTRTMSSMENFLNRFGSSHSDKGNSSMLNLETMADTLSDIFGQLYQMRAAASLSNLYNLRYSKQERKIAENFAEKFGAEYAILKSQNPKAFKDTDSLKNIWQELAQNSPEMKKIIDKQTRLSKSLSLGYMALTSSSDVYQDALDAGYDRRMAGLAGIVATVGQYGIMSNNKMGDWFLDATTGYKENVSRNVMKKVLRPYYEQIKTAVDDITVAATKETKLSTFAKIYDTIYNKGIKNFYNLIKDGGEEYWKRSIIEGVEEVTEEAVMDATKAMFDGLSLLGIGKNSETARFHAIDKAFSSEGAQRYFMNFLGGVAGGALFEFQGKVIQPKMDAWLSGKSTPEVKYSLVKEIMNGNTEELLKEIDRMTKSDSQMVQLIGENGSGAEAKTKSKLIGDMLKKYVHMVEGITADNGINIDNTQIFEKAVRDRMLRPVIENSGVLDLLINDFTVMAADLVAAQTKLNERLSTQNVPEEKKSETSEKENKKETNSDGDDTSRINITESEIDRLRQDLLEKKKEVQAFLNGDKQEHYLKLSLQYLHPVIRKAVLNTDKYSWTESKYNVKYKDLPETGAALSKEQIDREYDEWKSKADDVIKFKEIGSDAYDLMQQLFSGTILDYANSNYGEVRKVVMDKLLREENFSWGDIIRGTEDRNRLLRFSQNLSKAGLPGVNLEDKLKMSDTVKEDLTKRLVRLNKEVIRQSYDILEGQRKALLEGLSEEDIQNLGLTTEALSEQDYENQFYDTLLKLIKQTPVELLDHNSVNNLLVQANKSFGTALLQAFTKDVSEDLDQTTAKQLIDRNLIALGYSPSIDPSFNNINWELEALQYITAITAPKLNPEQNLNISDSVIKDYLSSQDVIDNEVVRNIKAKVLQDLIAIYPGLVNEIKTLDYTFKFTASGAEDFKSIFYNGMNENKTFEEMIQKWIQKLLQDNPEYINDSQFLGELKDVIEMYINDMVPSKELYEIALSKTSKNNPLFDALRKIGLAVFDGDDMKIFDLLEKESQHMSKLPDLTEYIRQGITKEAINNFLSKLDLLDALIIGMESSEIDPDHMIAYNVQMARWSNKWDNGRNADKYKTVNTETVALLHKDVDLLRNKLEFAKVLIETNTESKVKENQKTKKQFEDWMLQALITKASEFTIDGVSVFPPIDELEKKESTEERLAFIESTIQTKIAEAVKNGKNIDSIIEEIFIGLNLNKEKILTSGLYSHPLNSSWKAPSEYDMFVYLTTILGTNTLEFNYRLREVIGNETFKYLPFFTQEYAAKTMYSFANDSIGAHTAAVKWLYKDSEKPYNQKATQIFFTNGIAGSGKTSAVMSIVASMLGENKSIIAAPNKNQAEKLKTSLLTQADWIEKYPVMSQRELLSYFITDEGIEILEKSAQNPNSTESIIKIEKITDDQGIYVTNFDQKYIKPLKSQDRPSFIFIDEVTHFNSAQLIALDTVAAKYGIKILAAGDTSQKGAIIDQQPANIQDVFSFQCPPMTISVRSCNIHKKDNTDVMQSKLKMAEQIFLTEGYDLNNPKIKDLKERLDLKYFDGDSEFDGDKVVTDITVDDLKKIKQAANKRSGKIMVIANLDASGQISDTSLIAKLSDAGITDYDVCTPDDFHEKAVQGTESDYVIINDLPDLTNNWYTDLISLYTYLTRSLNGTLLRDKNGAYTKFLQISNIKASYTGPYILPGIDQQIKLKQQRIDELTKIIGTYQPQAPKKPRINSEPNPTPIAINESVNDYGIDEETETKIEENKQKGEESGRNREVPKMETVNPVEWIPNSLYGYGFFNHTSTFIDNGNHYSLDTNTQLDLDGLFGSTRIHISKKYIRGFIKFKNTIALYPDTESEEFKTAMRDPEILDFFWRINPELSSADNDADRRLDVYTYLVGDDQNPGKLHIDDHPYFFVKNYSKSSDRSAQTADEDPNALSEKDFWAGFGRRIYTDDLKINQYITCGALPKIATLEKWKIEHEAYKEFIERARKELKDASKNKVIVFKLPEETEFEPQGGLSMRSDPTKFYSLSALKNDLGIVFDSYDDSDAEAGQIKVGLITNEQKEVNGITTYSFLHYIAHIEHSTLSYEERIKQLEKAFVKDDKLIISGKYYAVGGFTAANDPRYKRVFVLDPQGYTFDQALGYQARLSANSRNVEDDKKHLNIFTEKARAMSQNSQKKLLTAAFQTLGAIDSNGLAIGDGVLPYVEQTLDYFTERVTNDKLRGVISNIRDLVTRYKNEHKDFDMDFISEAMRSSLYYTNSEGKREKVTQAPWFGIMLIDHWIAYTPNSLKVYKLLSEGETRRVSIDMDFDLGQEAYQEFGVGYQKVTQTFDDFSYETIRVNLAPKDYSSIGLSGHYVEMPKYSFRDEVFNESQLLSSDQARLSHKPIDFNNISETDKKEEEKLLPTTESITQLVKSFDPESQISYVVPPKKIGRFYHINKTLTREEVAERDRYTTRRNETNGFRLRAGDTIQIAGDVTHNYHISKIDFKKKIIEFDLKDGKDISKLKNKADRSCKFEHVSAIVGRELSSWQKIEKDFYMSDTWKETVEMHKEKKKAKSKVVSINNLSRDEIKTIFKNRPFVLLYAVKNSDNSSLTPINRILSNIKEGKSTELKVIDSGYDNNNEDEQVLEDAVNRFLEAVKELEKTEDLNGIAVVGLYRDGITNFSSNQESFLGSITEGYIYKYVSYTSDPKFIEKADKAEEKDNKDNKGKAKRITPSDKIKNIILESLDYSTAFAKIYQEIVGETKESLSEYSGNKFFKYIGADGKWHITPTMKFIETLEEDQAKKFIESIPLKTMVTGQRIQLQTSDGSLKDALVLNFDPDSQTYEYQYQTNGKLYTAKVTSKELSLLWNIKFISEQQTEIIPDEKTDIPITGEDTIKEVDSLTPSFESTLEEWFAEDKDKENVKKAFRELVPKIHAILTADSRVGGTSKEEVATAIEKFWRAYYNWAIMGPDDQIQYEDFINDVVNNDSVPKDIRYILCNMEEDVLNLFDDNFEHKKEFECN